MMTQFFFENINSVQYSDNPLRDVYKIRQQWKELIRPRIDLLDDQAPLVRLREDIESQNPAKFLELMYGENVTACRLFLILGFDPNTVYEDEYMLEHAFSTFDNLFLDMLHFFGAYVNAEDKKGTNLLQKAVRSGIISSVRWLIEKGARVNYVNYNLETPLRDSLKFCKNLEITELLIENGAEDSKFYVYAEKLLNDPEILSFFDKMSAENKVKFGVPDEMPEFVFVRL